MPITQYLIYKIYYYFNVHSGNNDGTRIPVSYSIMGCMEFILKLNVESQKIFINHNHVSTFN